MISTLLLCSGMIVAAGPADTDRADYETARVQAGRDPGAHVKLALWCEQHGMTAERAKHLALAVLTDPKNAVARGLMGFVQYQGGWKRPDDVAAKVKADAEHAAKFAEYAARRLRAPHTADGQWKLALWCKEQGLEAEATAQLWATIRLDPRREAAWKHLGYKKQGGRWVTDAQLAAEKVERALQEKADRHWKPLLEKWSGWLNEKDARRIEAEQALANITDPRAVPMVWGVFIRGGESRQRMAVRILGQIDAPGATRNLTLLALFSASAEVRRTAAETLNRRDPRDFAGQLIGFLGDPVTYQVRPVNGPGSRGEIFIEGKKADVKRLYSTPAAQNLPLQPNDVVGYDANGLPVVTRLGYVAMPSFTFGVNQQTYSQIQQMQYQMQLQAQNAQLANAQMLSSMLTQAGMTAPMSHHLGQLAAKNATPQLPGVGTNGSPIAPDGLSIAPDGLSFAGFSPTPAETVVPIGEMVREATLAAQQQLANDVASIERYNRFINELNGRIMPILTRNSGQDFGTDREAWQKWFAGLLGYAAQAQMASPDKPLLVEDVPLFVEPQASPVTVAAHGPSVQVVLGHSCFGRGTLVRTLTGVQPIESILAGDQVLTQDTGRGTLSYQPVLRALHNPPNKTIAITLEDEKTVVTGIHRFWKAGHGWVMARDLRTGDSVRTLHGTARVVAIEDAPVQPVFNLEVASGQSFFVGKQGALVHDNSLVQPVPEPFDAAPTLAAATSR